METLLTDNELYEACEKAAPELCSALEQAFSERDCATALFICQLDRKLAAEWLTDGKWMTQGSVSWNHESLREKAKNLGALTGEPEPRCTTVLQNCAGNQDLALRKLAGQPVLKVG